NATQPEALFGAALDGEVVSPRAASVAPPPSSHPHEDVIPPGDYALTAFHDGTGRAQQGRATIWIENERTYMFWRRVAETSASRSVETGTFEIDARSGIFAHRGAPTGRCQRTSSATPELIVVLPATTEIWR